jgi:hypothetical protein
MEQNDNIPKNQTCYLNMEDQFKKINLADVRLEFWISPDLSLKYLESISSYQLFENNINGE